MTAPSLDERYGRTPARARRGRVIAVIVAAGFAIVLIAWLVWAGLQGDAASIEYRDVSHEIVNDSLVVVTFEVTADPGSHVSCAVEALNVGFSVVGLKTIDLPPSAERSRTVTQEVRTTERAVSGLIYRCWLA